VFLEAIVLADGSIGPVRVTKSLDLDLDQSAAAAVRRWQFKPALKDGAAVPALVEIEMSFSRK
jgi:TonB family protein